MDTSAPKSPPAISRIFEANDSTLDSGLKPNAGFRPHDTEALPLSSEDEGELPWTDVIRSKHRKRAAGPVQGKQLPVTVIFKPVGQFAVSRLPPKAIMDLTRERIHSNGTELRVQNRSNVVAIDVKTNREAQELMQVTKIGNVSVRPYIARPAESIRGIVQVSVDFTDDELTSLMVCKEATILASRRLGAANPTVLVTFEGNRLPRVVHVGSLRVTVKPYRPKAVSCTNCLRFGHKADHCPNQARCSRCGEEHMTETACLA